MNLTEDFREALTYAFDLHRDQPRKGTDVPYMAHLLGGAALVFEYGGDEKQAIAALLHDAVEDQGGGETHAEIRERFGDDVARIVAACTDAWTEPKPDWRPRKERYLEHLEEASDRARLVSACDKLHNARAILRDYRKVGEEVWDRFTADKEETLWYYRSLAATFAEKGPEDVADELGRVVGALLELAEDDG